MGYDGERELSLADARHLLAVAEALMPAVAPAEVTGTVFDRLLSELGATTAGLWLLDGDVIEFAAGAGHPDNAPSRVGPIPLESDLPAAICIRTGTPVAYGSHAERDARWPVLGSFTSAAEAVVAVPLISEGRAFGCLHVGFPLVTPVEDMNLPLFARLGELCAAAINRSRHYEQERLHREQLEFFADATRVLASTLEPERVVQELVQIAVPRLAPWCAVLMPHGPLLRTAAVRINGDDGTRARIVASETFDISGDFVVSRCFRSARTQIVDPIPTAVTARPAVSAEVAGVVRDSGIHSALVVPIMWAGQAIGVLSLGFSRPGESSSEWVQETAEGLALRAGVAFHNASAYDAERTTAQTLTQALLPGNVPDIPGYDCAVRYVPASGDVAGDWYDVAHLGGRFLLAVGDAAGHGIPAATFMAELRNAARGLATLDLAPSEILDRLAVVAERNHPEAFATAVYGILTPSTNSLEWASAGHPPPAHIRGRDVTYLDHVDGVPTQGSPIVGGHRDKARPQRLVIGAGDSVVFYTDGVIERRTRSIDRGLDSLAALLRRITMLPVEEQADLIVNELCQDASDDCSIMLLRRRDQPGEGHHG
jgi:GAF domain-containing protein